VHFLSNYYCLPSGIAEYVLAGLASVPTWVRSRTCTRKLGRVNSGTYAIGLILILGSQLSPTSINSVPAQAGKVTGALAMCHKHRGLSIYTGSAAKDREMSTHAYAPWGRGTISLYLTCSLRRLGHACRCMGAISECPSYGASSDSYGCQLESTPVQRLTTEPCRPTPHLRSTTSKVTSRMLRQLQPIFKTDLWVMVLFSVPNSYTNYRPNKLPLLLATWCETITLTTNTDPNPYSNLTLTDTEGRS